MAQKKTYLSAPHFKSFVSVGLAFPRTTASQYEISHDSISVLYLVNMGAQTTTKDLEVLTVPADMLALRPVEQPVGISVPGNAEITITGHTNAKYYQKVTVEDVTGGRVYVFTGSGEDEMAMEVKGSKEKGVVLLHTLETKPLYRMLSLFCEYSARGPDGSLEPSTVLAPRVRYEYLGPRHLQRISWEISSEDGVDSDYNDSVIRIVADIDQDLS